MKKVNIVLLFILITGCSHLAVYQPIPWKNHTAGIAKLTNWQAKGKMGIVTRHGGSSANFTWQQQKQHLKLILSGPLGSSRQEFTNENINQHKLDIKIPAHSLPFWLRGIPDPDLEIQHLHLNPLNLLQNLKQDNWQINYLEYKLFAGIMLPRKIIVKKDMIKVKIIINTFYIGMLS